MYCFIIEVNRNFYGLCDDMNSFCYEDFKMIYIFVLLKDMMYCIVSFFDEKIVEIDVVIVKKWWLIDLLNE